LDEPIVYKLVKDFELVFNILQAKITPKEEGLMVLELKGKKENYAEGIKYLTKARRKDPASRPGCDEGRGKVHTLRGMYIRLPYRSSAYR